MRKLCLNLLAVGFWTCLLSLDCSQNQPQSTATDDQPSATNSDPKPRVERVLTKEEQDKLTPDEVLKLLKDGNRRFVSGTLTSRDHSRQVREAALGQYPKAVILSCLDSRIPVEDVFDRGIGDVFVARVAGNFENIDILGSMEFGCKVAGSKLILVLGHEHCGAVKGAIDDVELGNITPMLKNIRPAVEHFTAYEGDRSSENEEFVIYASAEDPGVENWICTQGYTNAHIVFRTLLAETPMKADFSVVKISEIETS